MTRSPLELTANATFVDCQWCRGILSSEASSSLRTPCTCTTSQRYLPSRETMPSSQEEDGIFDHSGFALERTSSAGPYGLDVIEERLHRGPDTCYQMVMFSIANIRTSFMSTNPLTAGINTCSASIAVCWGHWRRVSSPWLHAPSSWRFHKWPHLFFSALR